MGAYSMSNMRTWVSPAAVTRVRSEEWGINLTEKMFCVWPVKIWVFSEKPAFAL